MIIFVSSELETLKIELELKGYTVITNACDTQCDAIICDLKNRGLEKLNLTNSLKREGTVIIDSGFKNINEIENILNNRVFSAWLD